MLAHTWLDRGSDLTVLLLHGIAADRYQLERLWDLPCNIIAVDLPGHGESDCPAEGILSCIEPQVRTLLAEHEVKRLAIVGYSLGGYIAQLLTHSLGPKALVLISTGMRLPATSRIVDRAKDVLAKHEAFVQEGIDTYRRLRGATRVVATGKLQVGAMTGCLRELETEDLAALAKGISCPTLVMHGTRDLIIPRTSGQALARTIPGARYKEFPDDHVAIVQREDVRRTVRDFLWANSGR